MTTQMTSGQAMIVDDGDTIEFSCCDCRLTHDLTVKMDPDTMKVSIEVDRNDKATRAARRTKGGKADLAALWEKLNKKSPRPRA